MATLGETLWHPDEKWTEQTNLHHFRSWLKSRHQLEFNDLHALHRWSVENIDDFWQAIWDYFRIEATSQHSRVLGRREMPGAEWFPGARLNYARHILRNFVTGKDALLYASENSPVQGLTWDELAANVRTLATHLRSLGIKPGDRIAAYMSNTPEAVTALLACASIGAIWSSCSPDFGSSSVIDRLSQIKPKVLICVDGYYYKGKAFNRKKDVADIIRQLDSLKTVIYLPQMNPQDNTPPIDGAIFWHDVLDETPVPASDFVYAEVPFDHPLWILFTSGTTGLPKAIVHSHGGIILELHKLCGFHQDMKPGDRNFFYTTTGWMMWNFLVSSMLVGAVPVLYDGNPAWPEADILWKLADDAKVRLFGASPALQQYMANKSVVPKDKYSLKELEIVKLAGSPVSADCMQWFYTHVKSDIYVMPGSGGTDVCSGLCGAMPGLPVKAGILQMPHLGVDMHAFNDEGQAVTDEIGEMVICQPMPSMPLYFWNDRANERYLETYFDKYPGIWRQGDFIQMDADGGCIVWGRSDATLNRYGVRIGTAEIYRSIESIPEIEDSIVVNLDLPQGQFFMPLFVQMPEGKFLDDALVEKIHEQLRLDTSPRHIPDRIYQIREVPYTLTGKKMEVPIRRILMGQQVENSANRDAMANPQSLDYFIRFRDEQSDYSLSQG